MDRGGGGSGNDDGGIDHQFGVVGQCARFQLLLDQHEQLPQQDNAEPDADHHQPTPPPGSAASKKRPTSGKERCEGRAHKRVVSMPVPEASEGGSPSSATVFCPPAPDSWSWRKYGQKPIKGSPYPRGYYRCSSSKACPARKQVERSRNDPNTLVVTYTGEHNHPWPIPKTHHQNHHHNSKLDEAAGNQSPTTETSSPRSDAPATPQLLERDDPAAIGLTPSPEDSCYGSSRHHPPFVAAEAEDDLCGWFGGVGSGACSFVPDEEPLATQQVMTTLLLPRIMYDDDYHHQKSATDINRTGGLGASGSGVEEEESMFEGLGELPEWSLALRSWRGIAGVADGNKR